MKPNDLVKWSTNKHGPCNGRILTGRIEHITDNIAVIKETRCGFHVTINVDRLTKLNW